MAKILPVQHRPDHARTLAPMFAAEPGELETIEDGLPTTPSVRVQAVLNAALWLVAGVILAGWLLLLVFHISDDYRVTHNTGVWIAVSDAARSGRLYPPIFDGEHYAGTRYMPLPILLNALAAAIVGDPVVGGKVLAGVLMAMLLGLVVVALRRLSCPLSASVALAAVVVATETGLQAGTSIGGDLLPAVLQVGALVVVLRGGTPKQMLFAGILAGLGAASKLTGLWSFLAVSTWLVLQRQWRHTAIFAFTCICTGAAILAAVQIVTHGGLSAHLLAFSVAGVRNLSSVLRGPNQVLYQLLGYAFGAVVLVPLAVLGVLLVNRWRQLSVVHLAFAYALCMLLAVYADVGTGFNQLLDFVVLTVLATGYLAGRAVSGGDGPSRRVVVLAVAVSVLWAAGLDLVRTVGFDLRRTVATGAGRATQRSAVVAAGIVGPSDEVLAEDPSVYVALGRQPQVMDPFMVTRLDRVDPQQVDPLISWISNRRFKLVILVVSLEDKSSEYWWTDFHFGPRVTAALRKSYQPAGLIGRYYLYKPRP